MNPRSILSSGARRGRAPVLLFGLFAAVVVPARGSAQPGPADDLLERAATWLGAWRSRPAVAARFDGETVYRGQSVRPGPPFQVGRIEGTYAVGAEGRSHLTRRETNPGGTDRTIEVVLEPDGGWHVWTPRRHLTLLDPAERARLAASAATNPSFWVAHRHVADALGTESTASSQARLDVFAQGVEGNVRAVRYVTAEGDERTLFLEEGGRVEAVEWAGSDLRLGPVAHRVEFADYREVNGVRIAHAVRYLIGDEVAATVHLFRVRVAASLDGSRFAPPPDLEPPPAPAVGTPQPVADGVFAVRLFSGAANSYNTMVVALDGRAVIIEPVLTAGAGRATLRIASAVAGTPVAHVVATHHHVDHIGGAGAFLASGVELVTTPDAAAVVRQDVIPRLPSDPEGADIVEVEDRHVIGEGPRSVQVLRVPPSSHAAQMLVAWVPHARTLYVADLFAIPETGRYEAGGSAATLLDAVRRLGLDVEHIVPSHGVVGQFSDLLRAVEEGGAGRDLDSAVPPAGASDGSP